MAAIPTVGGWTAKEIPPSCPLHLSAFPENLRPPTNSATICANSRAMACCNADGSRYAYQLTPKGVQAWPCLFLFFHKRLSGPLSQTAAFTTLPTRLTHPTANSNLPITKPTRPSRASSTYLPAA